MLQVSLYAYDGDDEQIWRQDPEASISKYHVCKNLQSRATPISSITEEKQTKKQPNKQAKKRGLADNPLFVASIESTNTSSEQAMYIVSPAPKAVGEEIDSMSLSVSTIHRVQRVAWETLTETLRPQFVPNTPLIVYFDGKLLQNSDSRLEAVIDQMPIFVRNKH